MTLTQQLIIKGFIFGIILFAIGWFSYYIYIELKRKGIIDKIKQKIKRRKKDGNEQSKQPEQAGRTATTTTDTSTTAKGADRGGEGTAEDSGSDAGDKQVAEQRSVQTGAVKHTGGDSPDIAEGTGKEIDQENNVAEKGTI